MPDTMFRFDRPAPQGPVDVWQGRTRVGAIHHPELNYQATVTLFIPLRFPEIGALWLNFRDWKPVPFLMSWVHREADGPFELRWPWWRKDDALYAAIRATSADDAMEAILGAYDMRPELLEWRFISQMELDYEPFSDRFPRAKWMQW